MTPLKCFMLGAATLLFLTQPAKAEQCAETGMHGKPGSGLSCIVGGVENMFVEQPHAFPTAAVQKNGAVFMTIKNESGQEMKIVGARSEVAEKVELHTHMMDGGIMMMRPVEQYVIQAGKEISLEPMGHHIMLLGLKQPLAAGQGFVLYLDMEDGQTYVLNVMVEERD